jgi:glycosyltransferase involved in cell wall biosynthesis
MFVENHFPSDVRVRNESDVLVAAGYQVVVVALRRQGEALSERVGGVQVYRLPKLVLFQKTLRQNSTWLQKAWLKGKAFLGYLGEYIYFTAGCFAMSLYVAAKHGFDVIHAHNPPDTIFLVAAPYKLLGKKFVFDHHDLCPELYQSRYRARRDVFVRWLGLLEKCSLKLADITIATNESYKMAQTERGGVKPEKIFIVRNGPNLQRMKIQPPSRRLLQMNKTILCYIGSLNPQDGVDYLLRSLHHLAYGIGRREFYCVIMGSGDSLEGLRALADELKLTGLVELTGFVSDTDLLANLSAADICVDPDPSSPLNDVSTWIKIMEYMAYGKPIVSYDLKETRFSAREAALYVEPNDEKRFSEAIATLMDRPSLRKQMGDFGRRRVEEELEWSKVGQSLKAAYRALLSPNRSAAPLDEPSRRPVGQA